MNGESSRRRKFPFAASTKRGSPSSGRRASSGSVPPTCSTRLESALALPLPNYFRIVVAVLWVMAFASSTQDICVDGIYITSLDEKK